MQPSTERYTAVAIALHWSIALLVAFLLGWGWYMVDIPRGPERGAAFALHKSLGITVFVLMLARIAWRLTHPPPPLPPGMARWQRSAAGATHLLFYVLLLVHPLCGYLSSSFSGYSTSFYGIPLPDWGAHDPPLNEFFTELHVLGAVALCVAISAHVLGALKHLLTPGDSVAQRMWPFGK